MPQIFEYGMPKDRTDRGKGERKCGPHEGILTQQLQTTFIILLDDLYTDDEVKSFS
jgi:hypothetical protein